MKNNTGDDNTGDYNTGDRNTGDRNTGDDNTGDYNTGDRNTGYRNTGYRNTGNLNTGNHNTGYRNTGYHNTGNHNTGDDNTGDHNTGDHNTGNHNTGYRNTGDHNTGDYNTGNYNIGYFNTISPTTCMIFNKKASFDDWENSEKPSWLYVELTNWVYEEDMSDKEKEAFPSYVTEGGYLKVYSSLQAAWIDAWERTSEEDRELTFKLPNFDKAVFQEIFGFDPLTYCRESKNKEIVIDGKTIEISQESFEALKQQLLEG